MRKLIAFSFCLVFLCSCAGWQKKTRISLTGAHTAAKGLSAIVEPVYRKKCKDEALKCAAKEDKICKALTVCQGERRTINKAITAVHIAVAAGHGFLAISDKTQSENTLIKALNLIQEINEMLKKGGLL